MLILDAEEAATIYENNSKLLSKRNFQLAFLDFRICVVAFLRRMHSPQIGAIALKFAYSFHQVFRQNLPRGSYPLTYALLSASNAACIPKPPPREARQLVEQLRESTFLTCGTAEEAKSKNDRTALMMHDMLIQHLRSFAQY
ncbi:hypothetical protein PFISCL1PPCAC_24345 [Pristionchus fissidentatus]|uniref:Nuclear receptor n=1 Tax=Pristionchus fissidentatus TaxID=1538716 RepID=A0AAV5WNT2_9BILA|nr:hypothetical protein PFISCL1PPCAC_24345 [Pristionchus fissidentatus]